MIVDSCNLLPSLWEHVLKNAPSSAQNTRTSGPGGAHEHTVPCQLSNMAPGAQWCAQDPVNQPTMPSPCKHNAQQARAHCPVPAILERLDHGPRPHCPTVSKILINTTQLPGHVQALLLTFA